MKKTALAAASYLLVTFPLGFVWHLVLFKDVYESFGLYRGEPRFSLGVLSMVIQGVILAALYPRFRRGGSELASALRFCAMMGLFFASGTVIALAAKANPANLAAWLGYNLAFTALQFGAVAAAFALVFRGSGEPA